MTFLNGRYQYYSRIRMAKNNPDTIFCCISDGASQHSNKMPSCSNQKDFNSPLETHNQGVLEHGKQLVCFSSFKYLFDSLIYFIVYCLDSVSYL